MRARRSLRTIVVVAVGADGMGRGEVDVEKRELLYAKG